MNNILNYKSPVDDTKNEYKWRGFKDELFSARLKE